MRAYLRYAHRLFRVGLLLVLPGAANAAEIRATLVRPPADSERIADLQIDQSDLPTDGKVVRIEGRIRKPDLNLFYNSQVLELGADRKFHLEIPVAERQTMIELMAVSTLGEQKTEKILVLFRDAASGTPKAPGEGAAEAPVVSWPTLETLYATPGNPVFPKVVPTWSWNGGAAPENPWNFETRWRFSSETNKTPVGHPVLVVWVQAPAPNVVTQVEGPEGAFIDMDPKDSPWEKSKGPVFSVSVESASSTLKIHFTDAANREREADLKLEIQASRPFAWVDASCPEAGVDIGEKAVGSPYLFAAAKCESSSDFVDVYLFSSGDAKLGGGVPAEKSAEGPGWWRLHLPKPEQLAPDQRKSLTAFDILPGAGNPSRYDIGFRGVRRRGLSFSGGLGFTSISYAENPGSISVSQQSLTGKVNAFMPIIPKRLDAGGNFFVTLFSPVHSPSTLESARFYGLNGRIGYHLPWSPFGLDWSVSGGWYVWGMLVPNNTYGIQMLNGPQIFLLARMEAAGGKVHSGYLKFAPINEKPVIPSLGNHELAIGGAYQILGGGPLHALSLTLDLSTTSFTSDVDGNTMSLSTLSLGLQTPL